MSGLKPYMGDYYLWEYVPSLVWAVIFLIIFAILTGLHTYRLFSSRTWFCIPFVLGGLLEIYGYGGRIGAHFNTASLPSYVLSNDGIILAPALFAAYVYMTLGRLIRSLHAEKYSPVRLNWMTRAFVIGDILSLMVQGSSLGLSLTQHATAAMAVMLVGLFVQIISFGVFAIAAIIFNRRYARDPRSHVLCTEFSWQRILHLLFSVSVLIMIRSIFRVIEYWMGSTGYFQQHEWTMYTFDSIPMTIAMIVFYVWYPSQIQNPGMRDSLQDPLSNYGGSFSSTELVGNYHSLQ
ncbi:RTA1 domain protein [Penicillium herquei]|nr:RTA1 domain protein [Penicillium herquei]